ncbi:MAG: bifunctional transcriptional activator/DNA repair enzyme AdaA [Paracoccaceae bacterium]
MTQRINKSTFFGGKMQEGYHYQVIERALNLIEEQGGHWSLNELADAMGMSPAYFQRLFRKWVGVSPKNYQQYLTLDFAKQRLATHHSTIDAALSAGLSGTARLYDLFIKWEAMSPGEFAQGGEGLEIHWAVCQSPFGAVVAMITPRGLCGLGFVGPQNDDDAAFEDLARRWPKATYTHSPQEVEPILARGFAKKGDLNLHLCGSPFNIKVWQALLNIPSGYVTTYSDVAMAVHSPKAQRAVGSAIGRNPISYFIPCHRALRKNGDLGGYHWGLTTKRALLAHDSAVCDAHEDMNA